MRDFRLERMKKRGKWDKMINVAICDDDLAITGKIESIIQNIAKKNFIQLETEVFWNGKQLVELIENGEYFDIIFLDIEIGHEDGISIAKRIRKTDKRVLIIYVTSYECYMKDSFEVRPFQFLVKPVNEKRLEACFRSACEDINNEECYFRYNYQRISHKIPLQDILYFESNKRKIRVITATETFELYGKLNDIEESLKSSKISFLRVHQSFLVNYRHIDGLSYDFLILNNGKRISISEERRKKISESYCAMEDIFYVGK